MNLALRKPMTLAEFLEWEERQPMRYEFDASPHSDDWRHIMATRHPTQSRYRPWRASPRQAVPIPRKRPQISGRGGPRPLSRRHGLCSPVDRTATVVYDPVVVFEVLSPSTARDDRIVKAREYQATPSVQRYVMLEQDGVSATVYARSGETWTHEILIADSILALPEIEVELPLAELYEGIVFETQAELRSDLRSRARLTFSSQHSRFCRP